MEFFTYFFQLVRRSLHITLRWLEILEAIAAITCYSLKFWYPQWDHLLECVSFYILVLLGVTFIFGLIWAAYLIDKEKEGKIREIENKEKERKAQEIENSEHEDDDWFKEQGGLMGRPPSVPDS